MPIVSLNRLSVGCDVKTVWCLCWLLNIIRVRPNNAATCRILVNAAIIPTTYCPHIRTIAGYAPTRSIAYPSYNMNELYSLYKERVTLLFLAMDYVDKSYVTTSTWTPGLVHSFV